MGADLTDEQYLSVEEYLLDQGYVADANIRLSWSAYTITPAGLKWLETVLPEPLLTDHRGQELAEGAGEEEAFESDLRAELEEERRRMEDLERDLNEERPGAPKTAAEAPDLEAPAAPEARESPVSPGPGGRPTDTTDAEGGREEATERRWWRFWR